MSVAPMIAYGPAYVATAEVDTEGSVGLTRFNSFMSPVLAATVGAVEDDVSAHFPVKKLLPRQYEPVA